MLRGRNEQSGECSLTSIPGRVGYSIDSEGIHLYRHVHFYREPQFFPVQGENIDTMLPSAKEGRFSEIYFSPLHNSMKNQPS